MKSDLIKFNIYTGINTLNNMRKEKYFLVLIQHIYLNPNVSIKLNESL
jgi:hypothetical protein